MAAKKRFTTAQQVSETRSKAQRKAWKKRKAMALAKSCTVVNEEVDEVSFGLTDELVKDTIASRKLHKEFDVIKWINAADSPSERQLRKSVMHGMLYSGEPLSAEGLLQTAQRIRDERAVELDEKATVEPKTKFNPDAFLRYHPEGHKNTCVGMEQSSNPKTLTGQQKVPVLSVIPPASIIAQATAMRYGAFFAPRVDSTRGYGPYNWRDQPIEAHIYIDAAIRHLMQWWDGDEYELIHDDEGRTLDEISHLAFALATIGILIDARANGTMIDDRPRVRNKVATGMLHDHKIETSKK